MVDWDLPLLLFIWLLIQIKAVLFWVYLWQLKDYHLGRFLAHFETAKGKQIFASKIFIAKIALFLMTLAFIGTRWEGVVIVTLVFYALLGLKTIYDFIRRDIKVPVFNLKTTILSIVSLALLISGFWAVPLISGLGSSSFLAIFVAIDAFNFLIISGAILLLQPVTIAYRNWTISRARAKRLKIKELLVIGITGSYGKSATKDFLSHLLSYKYNVLKTSKNQNSEMGISRCILDNLKPSHQIFVCEMGAYGKGGIKLLCDIVRPAVGILTGINQQHLSTFGSQKNITDAKFELIEALPPSGLAIVNGDNYFIAQRLKDPNFKPPIKTIKQVSLDDRRNFRVSNIEFAKGKIFFVCVAKGKERAEFEINAVGGRGIVADMMLAIACCRELGMSLEEIAQAAQGIKSGENSARIAKGVHGFDIIHSTYSANPDGVLDDLEYLKIWEDKKKAIVMPCLIELGNEAAKIHQDIGEKIGQVCDLAIITTKDHFEDIKKGAERNVRNKAQILYLEDPLLILKEIQKVCILGDVILLESRVPEGLIRLLETPNFHV